jgi:protease I
MKAVFVVAQRGYQDFEYNTPKRILEQAGVEVITASKLGGTCVGKLGGMVKETLSLADVKVENYDLVVFIGGPGALEYQHDPEALHLAKEAFSKYKWIAAICIAPTILAYSGVLKGRKATVWNGDGKQDALIKAQGAKYTGEKVTVDGKIITANGPEAAEEFGKTLLNFLKPGTSYTH